MWIAVGLSLICALLLMPGRWRRGGPRDHLFQGTGAHWRRNYSRRSFLRLGGAVVAAGVLAYSGADEAVDSFHSGKVRSRPTDSASAVVNLDDLRAGARVDVNEKKRDPVDFALWKASKPGEPEWESPWGPGRPGWHIECSAMSKKYLGVTFDIHGGGKDLVFPHHENEIAQSHACSGQAPVNVWIHNGFVNMDSEKMSKSIGNIKSIKDILKANHPEAVRLFLMTSHYRSPIDFSAQGLSDAHKLLARFYDFLMAEDELGPGDGVIDETAVDKFTDCMDDDFNTATALAHLITVLRLANQLRVNASEDEKEIGPIQEGKQGRFATPSLL